MGHGCADRARLQPGIRIQKQQPLALSVRRRLRQREILPGPARREWCARKHAEPGLVLGDAGEDAWGVISRVIVDDQDFEVRVVLLTYGLETTRDVLRLVARWHDHRDQRPSFPSGATRDHGLQRRE